MCWFRNGATHWTPKTCIGSVNDWPTYWLENFAHPDFNIYRGLKSAKIWPFRRSGFVKEQHIGYLKQIWEYAYDGPMTSPNHSLVMLTCYVTYLGQDEIVCNAFGSQERSDKMTNWASFSAHGPQCKRVHVFLSVTHANIHVAITGSSLTAGGTKTCREIYLDRHAGFMWIYAIATLFAYFQKCAYRIYLRINCHFLHFHMPVLCEYANGA